MGKENKRNFRSLLFVKLFGGKQTLSILEEEQMQGPIRTIIRNFRSNVLAMTGLCIFLIIFLFMIFAPIFFKLDLSYSESSQINVEPGLNMLDVPASLKGKVADISVGPTFTVAVSTEGRLYIWGKTKVSRTINLKNAGFDMGKVVKVSAGYDHIAVLNDQGKLFAWGSDRQKQAAIPPEVEELDNIIDVVTGYQCTIVLTADGYSYFFGNDSINDYMSRHAYQGQLAKIDVTSDAVFGLTYDGQVVYLGKQTNSYTSIPEGMGKVVDITSTASTMAALNEDGRIFIWGNITEKGEGSYPLTESKVVSIQGGNYHYTAVTEDNQVIAWGANNFKQAAVPSSLDNKKVLQVYSGFYQNYAITEDGDITPWGLKGYLLGSDDLGRDILNRLINGGRMSMTIGAIAVIISTIIGVIVGCVSGFFGGRLDMFLQRVVEIISALPFLPFAMILSAFIGNKLPPSQRTFLIMVILGFLQWPGLSRLVRAQVLAEREKEFVTAAKAVGVRKMPIVFKHILPNVISVVIVSATLDFATCMLTEATLSYLGFGVQAPQPTWGNMLYGSSNSIVIQNYWWRWVYASIILATCVICINLTGDGLRDAVDPKSKER